MVYRALMTAGWVAGAVSLAALAILAARPASRSRAGRALLGGGLFTVCLLLAFGLLMLLGWSFFFDSFHRTLFEDGTWTFYWSDTLIRLFPLRFWQDVAAAVLGLVALGAAMLAIAGWLWRRRTPTSSAAASTAGPRC
jgi:integral membrane protein (TIGR01906 family)